MEKSSHYYALLCLCLIKGLRRETAGKIAYASQFVDDATINYLTFAPGISDPLGETSEGKVFFRDIATCHSYFRIMTFNYQSMIRNTSLFHFFPGNTGSTFTERMRCIPDPRILRDLLTETAAAIPFNPARFGMLLHVYADSFAHQGFSGLLSIENDILGLETDETMSVFALLKEKWKNLFLKSSDTVFDSFIPSYGHGQALTNPDIPFRKWSYTYATDTGLGKYKKTGLIENEKRYRSAFDSIAEFLGSIGDSSVYLRPDGHTGTEGADTEVFYRILFKSESTESKTAAWRGFIRKLDKDADRAYDKEAWLRESFSNYDKNRFDAWRVEEAIPASGFRTGSWYHFIEAVLWYKKETLARLARDGLTIPL